MKEFERYERIGTEPHRSYYIPFDKNDKIGKKYGIVDRKSSSRFVSLDGIWQIKAYDCPQTVDLAAELTDEIPVPSCVQMHGYDQIQYLNQRFPFPVRPPYVPHKNPTWHYRRIFNLSKREGERYYLNFEGVDSAFYLYINGEYCGYSQISHATSEFDITDKMISGENAIDVVVLKWCASTYLECQDKFRFSGIFRNVYILRRPEKHLRDFKIETLFDNGIGRVRFKNEGDVPAVIRICDKETTVSPRRWGEVNVGKVKLWSADEPKLYSLDIIAGDELIPERVGFRSVEIDGKLFKINGELIKLKGVNRHDFNSRTAATVTLANLVEDIKLMKSLNVNAVRTSHYPNSPEFYQLCDALGLFAIDEADLETHGAAAKQGGYSKEFWQEYADMDLFAPGILDRHTALVERDKNRPSVIIWSLGNEASFGTAFFDGLKYIRNRDKTRPVHYEGVRHAEKKYHYSKKYSDFGSAMYPPLDYIKKRILEDPKETRPFIMCEYTHAMGNSSGDISAYWELINANDQLAGAFVWEWADHAIKTPRGYLYGGDFGESEHDGNFCVDGLVTADRKLKSTALEMKAVYGGKIYSPMKDIPVPEVKASAKEVAVDVSLDTGCLLSVKADEKEIIARPMRFNLARYIDNDRRHAPLWFDEYKLCDVKSHVLDTESRKDGTTHTGFVGTNCFDPFVDFKIDYAVSGAELTITVEYSIADYVKRLPRFGIEFGISRECRNITYLGYGPTESYSDKHIATDYGIYETTPEENYDKKYLRPQESGSHYATKYLKIDGAFTLTAEEPFSFSVNPYTTKDICECKHNFEFPEHDFYNVCIDLAMRGIGSHSCGPELEERYEIPRKARNVFKFTF